VLKLYDLNGDGVFDFDEFIQLVSDLLCLRDGELSAPPQAGRNLAVVLAKQIPGPARDTIEVADLVELDGRWASLITQPDMVAAGGDGLRSLSDQSLHRDLKDLRAQRVVWVVTLYDLNGDGVFDFDEFIQLVSDLLCLRDGVLLAPPQAGRNLAVVLAKQIPGPARDTIEVADLVELDGRWASLITQPDMVAAGGDGLRSLSDQRLSRDLEDLHRLRAVPPPPPPPPSDTVLLAPGAPLAQLHAFPGDYDTPPPYWSHPGSQDGLQQELRPESPVFQEVLQMLCDSGTDPASRRRTDLASRRLSAIYCVENRGFFREYQARRTTMLSLPRLNERWLWHGTDEKSIPLILANGFLRDFNTRGAHGKGVYFARQAAYSLSPRYSKIDPDTGEHYLLLCRVLMGEACVGSSGMERPTQKPNSNAMHESMVDRLPVEQSQIVVLSAGSDKQAYPEFVLKFQKRDEGGGGGGGGGSRAPAPALAASSGFSLGTPGLARPDLIALQHGSRGGGGSGSSDAPPLDHRIAQLQAMGFADVEAIKQALEASNGDVEQALALLVE